MNRYYHVSKKGSDFNIGTEDAPFLTIQKAAEVAIAGDTIIVHGGVYREWVKPRLGGLSNDNRITYMAAEGEKVVVKGSEVIKGWENLEGTVWKVEIENSFFGEYNPYATEIEGDWLVAPREHKVHTGDVYLNGKSFFEAISYEKVVNPDKWTASIYETWGNCEEKLVNPEDSIYRWYAEVGQEKTIIYANFHGANPNEECVEINVRKSCFFPERTGINYITVKGFELAQAATTWAPPTSLQYGIVGPHWSKGWSKETVGSHIVRNNVIYDCGQNGIVGHLGSAFCEIYGNEIYNIGVSLVELNFTGLLTHTFITIIFIIVLLVPGLTGRCRVYE